MLAIFRSTKINDWKSARLNSMRISSLRSIANVTNPFHSLDYFCLNLCPFCFVVRAAICFVGLRLVEIRFIFLDFGLCSAFIVFRQNVVLSQIRALCCNHLSVILTPKRTCYCNVNKSQLKTCASTQSVRFVLDFGRLLEQTARRMRF